MIEAEKVVGEAEKLLAEGDVSHAFAFGMSAAILLREGFESVLVIIAILGVIRALNARAAARWVHAGWITAVALGIVAWFASDKVVSMSGLGREMMEGVAALAAVAILLYLGFWMHSKTEIGRWKEFIHGRITDALTGGKLFTLAAISFVAVFREAFETVLFLSALNLEAGPAARGAIGWGVVCAAVLVGVMHWALLRYSAKIPVRRLFAISSWVMVLLAVVLIGKGFHSLQESGVISVTTLPVPRFDLAGLYPTWETFAAQVAVVAISLFLWWLGKRPSSDSTPGATAA
ncbi:MAG: FTR1 family protein [Verrucomicrobiales bacterium]